MQQSVVKLMSRKVGSLLLRNLGLPGYFSSIYLCSPDKSKLMLLGGYGSPFWFLTSVTKRDIHSFRFCVSALSSRSSGQVSSFPSLRARSFLIDYHPLAKTVQSPKSIPLCVYRHMSCHHHLHFSVFQRAAKAPFSSHACVLFWLFRARCLKIRIFVLHCRLSQ